ncbi:molybdopterin synthase sulfur carrier subunit [Pseudoalteromonas sp. FUC4]|uniref:MoaD/ThiS family protein n=1 Tax=Pseudoalteromonas sp. FUC4 TaxID=2511201 RepID=UPI0011F35189|nr:MoaD/ThiS family protein [Pseudoalteromonas sp. FUC4]KAA1155023.1 molybdopterin synthase sulfur carrier subunit [Pseudoalteromonas sp. FUC4]
MAVGNEINQNDAVSSAGKVELLFFGQLKERLKCSKLSLEITQPLTISELKLRLVSQYPHWQPWLEERELLAALNQTMSSSDVIVKAGDELAFFPPVTGG